MVRDRLGSPTFSDGSIPGKVSTGNFGADPAAAGINFAGGDFRRQARSWSKGQSGR
jgi:hypothetical protein